MGLAGTMALSCLYAAALYTGHRPEVTRPTDRSATPADSVRRTTRHSRLSGS